MIDDPGCKCGRAAFAIQNSASLAFRRNAPTLDVSAGRFSLVAARTRARNRRSRAAATNFAIDRRMLWLRCGPVISFRTSTTTVRLSVLARLVLLDKKNRVCGDTAAFSPRCSYAWAYASTCCKPDIKGLAPIAARLLDESLGKTCRAYKFSTFESNGGSDGYFVFDCDCYQAAPADLGDPAATAAVMMSCVYVGYVRRDH